MIARRMQLISRALPHRGKKGKGWVASPKEGTQKRPFLGRIRKQRDIVVVVLVLPKPSPAKKKKATRQRMGWYVLPKKPSPPPTLPTFHFCVACVAFSLCQWVAAGAQRRYLQCQRSAHKRDCGISADARSFLEMGMADCLAFRGCCAGWGSDSYGLLQPSVQQVPFCPGRVRLYLLGSQD